MEYTALVVAAGSGSRVGLGYNKMLYKLQNGNTILEETLQVFQQDARCHQIVVVASAQDMETFHEVCDEKNICIVEGGTTRQESVWNGLQKVNCSHVLIHDGARPWLSIELWKN